MYLAFERGARHKDVLENTLGGERRILRRIIERLMGGTDAESYRVGCGEGGHDVKETFFLAMTATGLEEDKMTKDGEPCTKNLLSIS